MLLIVALAVSLSGCGVVPGLAPGTADAPTPTPVTPQGTSPSPSSGAAPSASADRTPSATKAALTISQARQAVREWVGKYNATLKKRKWWRQDARLDALFVEAALYEGVLERNP